MGDDHEKTKIAAITRQVHMGIEAYHREYGKYPQYLDELDGKNVRKKVFFDGIVAVVDKYDLKMAFDTDMDGFVEVEGEKVELKIAVWTFYKDKRISSWSK